MNPLVVNVVFLAMALVTMSWLLWWLVDKGRERRHTVPALAPELPPRDRWNRLGQRWDRAGRPVTYTIDLEDWNMIVGGFSQETDTRGPFLWFGSAKIRPYANRDRHVRETVPIFTKEERSR